MLWILAEKRHRYVDGVHSLSVTAEHLSAGDNNSKAPGNLGCRGLCLFGLFLGAEALGHIGQLLVAAIEIRGRSKDVSTPFNTELTQ